MTLQAVLFDLGSTLLYYDATWGPESIREATLAMVAALQQAGLDLTWPDFISAFESRENDYYKERETEFLEISSRYILRSVLGEFGYPEIPDALIRDALKALYRVSQAHWLLEEDALPMLLALKQQGYRLGIISNASDDEDVQTLIDKAQIRPFFDFIIVSAAVGIRKPHPRIFRMALDRWNLAPDQAVMVGDTLGADILGAHNVGMRGVWITRRANKAANRDHLDTIRPDAQIASLAELPGLLAE
jgi:HAD superfamily hydrolase (TIGR01662 family)